MNRRFKILGALSVVALAAAGCGGGTTNNAQTGGTLTVGVDLPFTGSSQTTSDATWDAMNLYLQQVGGKAGNYTVQLKKYDDATAATGAWDAAKCEANAHEHVDTAGEVAIMGTYNSGCAKIIAPIVNQASMLMVSDANTNPGLTKKWDTGEPDKYFPSGKRSYARVVTTDDIQGPAAAQFAAKDLKVTKCLVLDDTETYGKGVADTFQAEATKQGITIVNRTSWKKGDANYTGIFNAAKTAGADCVFLGGIYDNNGGQLIKDKVAVLGDNSAVKVIAPDGFTGYLDFNKLPAAQGVYLTFAGLSTDVLKAAGGVPANFIKAYADAHGGKDPTSSYALYGVQALQVILAAIEKSDGTRDGVRKAVFEGTGISIPADKAIVGKAITIDPASGDVSAKDITVEVVKNNDETFLKAWPVS